MNTIFTNEQQVAVPALRGHEGAVRLRTGSDTLIPLASAMHATSPDQVHAAIRVTDVCPTDAKADGYWAETPKFGHSYHFQRWRFAP